MKTFYFVFGFAACILVQLAWKYRAILIPWLRTEEQKIVDKLAKKKDS